MPEGGSTADFALDSFVRRKSPNGLLLRYAGGRVRGFAARQVLTLLGAGALAVLETPWLGIMTLLLGLSGDAADCALLHRISRRYEGRVVPRRWHAAELVTGWLQGVTIALSVALTWTETDNHSVEFFSTSFLIGTAINAGLARPYCAPMADQRMATLPGVKHSWSCPTSGRPRILPPGSGTMPIT